MPKGAVERVGQWIPGVRAVRTYKREWLRRDVVAGVVLAAILVPQGMAYAELAGLPAVTGLYTTIACLVGYALFGPSRVLVLGPDSSVSPLILAAITPLLLSGTCPSTVFPSWKVTMPVGVPEPGGAPATVAVKATDWPGFDGLGEETSAVVVPLA